MTNLPYTKENKKLFVDAVQALINQEKIDSTFCEAVRQVTCLHSDFYYNYDQVRDSLIDILEKKFLPDTSEDAIAWMMSQIYPLFDEKKEHNCNVIQDNKKLYFLIETPSQLYDFEWKKFNKLKAVKEEKL